MAWPVHYRASEPDRIASLRRARGRALRAAGLPAQAGDGPLARRVGHRVRGRTPGRCRPRRCSPSPTSARYLGAALDAGARAVKVHVQVGGFDPRDPLLRPAWGLLAEAGVPVDRALRPRPDPRRAYRPRRLRRGPRGAPAPAAVLAHAGMPDFGAALDLLAAPPERVHLDTTMVGTAVHAAVRAAAARLAGPARRRRRPGRASAPTSRTSRTPTPSRCAAVAAWAAADDRLGAPFLRSVLHDAAGPVAAASRALGGMTVDDPGGGEALSLAAARTRRPRG